MEVFRIVSREIPVHERATAIQDAYASVAGVAVVPDPDAPLVVDASLHDLSGLTIARSHCSPCTVNRSAAQIVDGDDDLVVCIVAAGSLAVRSRTGQWIHCGPGDVYLGPNDMPSTRVYSRPSAFFDVTVPRGLLPPELQNSVGTLQQRKLAISVVPELRLLADYVDLLTRGGPMPSPRARDLVGAHVRDLLVASLESSAAGGESTAGGVVPVPGEPGGLRAARRAALRADVANRAADHDLSIDAVARRHHISPQYVRTLFREAGTTFTGVLRAERLRRAHHQLTDARLVHRTISDIAYECGFNDLSHFNRVFRRRYGMTPSDARRSADRIRKPVDARDKSTNRGSSLTGTAP